MIGYKLTFSGFSSDNTEVMKIMDQKLHCNSIKNKPQETGVMFIECQITEDENVMRERKVDIYTVGTVLVRSPQAKMILLIFGYFHQKFSYFHNI